SPDPWIDLVCITSSCPCQFLQVYSTSIPQSGRRPQHQKRTKRPAWTLSALPPKADIASPPRYVRSVPTRDIAFFQANGRPDKFARRSVVRLLKIQENSDGT